MLSVGTAELRLLTELREDSAVEGIDRTNTRLSSLRTKIVGISCISPTGGHQLASGGDDRRSQNAT